MVTTTEIGTSTALILAIAAIVMSSGLIGQENVYVCEDLKLAIQCDKLSSVNTEGLITRCYFFSEDLNRTTYKTCKSGWLPYEPEVEIEIQKLNISEYPLYLICAKTSPLISECQIIESKDIIYKVENS